MINFVEPVININGEHTSDENLTFFKKGFILNGVIEEPTWQDVTIAGKMSLTLLNAKANGLNYLKAFGRCEQRRLPSEYTQLEYLESTGTQYLELGINDSNPNLEIETTFSDISGSGYRYITGCWSKDTDQNTVIYINGNGKIGAWVCHAYTDYAMVSADIIEKHTVKVNKDAFYLDGNLVTSTFATGEERTGAELYAFKRNGAGGSSPQTTSISGKIYNISFKDNGVLIRNYIPARRNSDNVLGMYDTVTDTFFTNSGTGTFIAGTEIVPLPAEYTQLEYLQSSGTQYIAMGIMPDDNTDIGIVVSDMNDKSAQAIVAGASTGSGRSLLRIVKFSADELVGATIGTTRITSDSTGVTKFKAEIINKTFYLDGVSVGSSTDTVSPEYPLELFRGKYGASASNIYYSKFKCYSAYVKQNGAFVLNLIPAKRNSDNVLGMYDLVTGNFLTNAGTGTFIAGAEIVTTPSPDNPIPIWCNNGVLKAKDGELPVGYKRVKDLIYDGNSYFITNYKLKGSDTLRFKFNATNGGVCVVGCYNGADVNNNFSFYFGTGSGGSYARYSSELYRPKSQSLNTDYNVVFSPTGITGLDNNVTWQAQTFTSDAYFYIGFLDNSTTSPFIGAIKGNVVIDNQAKYIPCERTSDNTLGYYDTYSQTFFENQGTGTLSTSGYDYTYTSEIYTDGTQETIEAHGNNLFNKDLVPDENKYIDRSDGTKVSPNAGIFRHSDYIEIKENTQYYVGVITSTANYAGLAFYNDTKTYISGISLTQLKNANNIITSPSDTKYIRFSFRIDEGYNTNWENTVYFVEGTQPLTVYEPYFNGGTATAENLLSVGDYEDVQEVILGDVTREVGIKVLNGTEDWVDSSTPNVFLVTFADKLGKKQAYCTHFDYSADASYAIADNQFGANNQNIYYFKYSPANQNLDNWKTFLQQQLANGTPVVVVYPLKTATTETVTGQPLTIQKGTNIIEVTQSSIDDLELEAQYKAGVAVTIEEVENANLDNSVSVTIGE